MNIQELIEKYKKYEDGLFDIGAKVACQHFLNDLEQLDEQKPVKVQQCVADWITHSKNIGRSLFGAMSIFEENFEIKKWMQWAENQETFARAWIFGYDVEKEKRYTVKIIATEQYLVRVEDENFLGFLQSRLKSKFTPKELQDFGFGWVFDCPGIEVQEVE